MSARIKLQGKSRRVAWHMGLQVPFPSSCSRPGRMAARLFEPYGAHCACVLLTWHGPAGAIPFQLQQAREDGSKAAKEKRHLGPGAYAVR